jgi:hypothetical protein
LRHNLDIRLAKTHLYCNLKKRAREIIEINSKWVFLDTLKAVPQEEIKIYPCLQSK